MIRIQYSVLYAFILLLFSCLLFGCQRSVDQWSVSSPDKKLTLTVARRTGQLSYTVQLGDSTVLAESPMGLDRRDGLFSDELAFVSADAPLIINESYILTTGKQRQTRNHANEQTLTFQNEKKQSVQVVLRAYDDGVAFRYRFPESATGTYELTGEKTGFNLPTGSRSWIQPYDSISLYSPGYERYYTNNRPVGESAPEPEGWCFGGLFKTPSAWLFISEAGLDGTYPATRLARNAPNGLYTVRFPGADEGQGTGQANPQSQKLPWATPWRVIAVGKSLATLVESNLITHLSEPAKLTDVSWIKPGLVGWSWWADPASPKNYASLIPFVDFAAEWKLPYFLVDANWNFMQGGTAEQLIRYANQKGVGIWLWYNSGGPHNAVTEAPRDRMWDSSKRRAEFARLQKLGVKGVKIDFFQSDKQLIIQQYIDILASAAECHIMVNFHGCTFPRGWQRTWPNLVGIEAIAGEENYMFRKTYPEIAVWHNTIQPFTRNIAGPMDYTPTGFTNKKYPHQTTYANELALLVVFESGVVHLIDFPAVYQALPSYVQAFIKQVPTVWDETKYIAGYPGKEVVVARRSGKRWYLGGINGEKTRKNWSLPLNFLLKGRNYHVKLIADGGQVTQFLERNIIINGGDALPVSVLPAGGFVALIDE
ncbi:glycoside hydrolase family 97 catalytic domain-containing protein [uncultured Fibrella sp.]|uniref:glycoside hydrolase family 97 protein n=1 Tax=uncultured Fibrella sp. TaxID=1284596 RepID=UPI0035C95947